MRILFRLRLTLIVIVLFFSSPAQLTAEPEQLLEVPILPFDQVKVGMVGIGKSVFQGYTVEEFPIEIIAVIPAVGPKSNLILAKIGGKIVEYSGIISGMSGSPIYIDGRLVGALAYAWPFAKEPLAGITPIEQMIKIIDKDARAVKSGSLKAATFLEMEDVWEREVTLLPPPFRVDREYGLSTSQTAIQRITFPLVISGCSDELLSLIEEMFRPLGFVTVRGGHFGHEPRDIPNLESGSAVGIDLLTGDMSLSGVGTATYVDDNQVLAFGHPFFQLGQIEMPMVHVFVHTVFPSEFMSFKVTSSAQQIGTMVQDRIDGVLGKLGQAVSLLPIEINVHNTQDDSRSSFHYEAIRHEIFTRYLAYIAFLNSMFSIEKSVGESTVRVRSSLELKDRADIRTENLYSSLGALSESGQEIISLLSLLTNPFEELRVNRISFEITLEEAIKIQSIQEIRLSKQTLEPGEVLQVTLTLQPFQAEPTFFKIEIPSSASWPDGRYRLDVSDQKWYFQNNVRRAPLGIKPRNLDQLITLLTTQQDKSKIYVVISHHKSGLALRGEEYHNIPSSVITVLQPAPMTGNGSIVHENVVFKQTIPTNSVITGYHSIGFEIRKNSEER